MSVRQIDLKLLMMVLAMLATAVTTPASHAAVIDMDPGTTGYYSNDGSARGIHFTANGTTRISSIGIYANLAPKTFDALIFSGDTGGSMNLAAAALDQTPVELETGEAWHDIAINHTLHSENDYIILWRPNDQQANTWVIGDDLLAYAMSSSNPDDDVDLGAVTLRGGRSNFEAQDNNGDIPRMRLLTPGGRVLSMRPSLPPHVSTPVPEPAALPVMLMLGSAALMRRRRR